MPVSRKIFYFFIGLFLPVFYVGVSHALVYVYTPEGDCSSFMSSLEGYKQQSLDEKGSLYSFSHYSWVMGTDPCDSYIGTAKVDIMLKKVGIVDPFAYMRVEGSIIATEETYFVDSYCVCTDTGEGIYFAYGQCSDSVPTGDIAVIGNTKLYTSISSETPVPGLNAQCSMPGGSCGYTAEELDFFRDSLSDTWGADCGTDFDDDDGDGVANEDDNCPLTPSGAVVDRFGCELPDSDDDGVDDDHDFCPGTAAGVMVDSDGCPVDDDEDPETPDSDGDGVDDDHDSCPGTAAGVTVGPDGCPPPPDPGDGDSDDDAELLSDIVDWLKNISGTADNILGNVSDIENINGDILNAQRTTAGKVQDQVDEQKTTNKKLSDSNDSLDVANNSLTGIKAAAENQVDEQKTTNSELSDANDSLTAIKTAIQNQDSKLSGIESNTGKLADSVVDQGSLDSTWSGADGSDYNPTKFSTEYQEGVDFDAAPALEDQGWFSNFISSNPLKVALDNSGITTSGTCSVSVDCGSLGTHTLSLCEFESEFAMAGTMLYALTCLSALILIAKGGR